MSSVTQTLRAESPARIAAGRSVSSARAASSFKRVLTASEGSERVVSATARALAATEQEIVRLKAECTALAARVAVLEAALRTKEALYEQAQAADSATIASLREQVIELTAENEILRANNRMIGEKLHSAAMRLPAGCRGYHFVSMIPLLAQYFWTVEKLKKENFGHELTPYAIYIKPLEPALAATFMPPYSYTAGLVHRLTTGGP